MIPVYFKGMFSMLLLGGVFKCCLFIVIFFFFLFLFLIVIFCWPVLLICVKNFFLFLPLWMLVRLYLKSLIIVYLRCFFVLFFFFGFGICSYYILYIRFGKFSVNISLNIFYVLFLIFKVSNYIYISMFEIFPQFTLFSFNSFSWGGTVR